MENVILGLALGLMILVPLGVKWELPLKPVIVTGAAVGPASGILLCLLSPYLPTGLIPRVILLVALILLFSGAILLVRFYRDPERVCPATGDSIICPADGVVKYIKPIEENSAPLSAKGVERVELAPGLLGVLPGGRGYLVGIGMSFLDVHVTRAPIGGKITFSEHVPGSFLSLKRPEAVCRNERVNQVIENDRFAVGLIHIASRLVRRIVPRVGEGERIAAGERIGMIKFGSQVDMVLPRMDNLRLKIAVGEKVVAGETVIALFEECQQISK